MVCPEGQLNAQDKNAGSYLMVVSCPSESSEPNNNPWNSRATIIYAIRAKQQCMPIEAHNVSYAAFSVKFIHVYFA